jgi:hypothetical protein
LSLLTSTSSDACETLIRKDIANILATTMEAHLTNEDIQVIVFKADITCFPHFTNPYPLGAKLLANRIVCKAFWHRPQRYPCPQGAAQATGRCSAARLKHEQS